LTCRFAKCHVRVLDRGSGVLGRRGSGVLGRQGSGVLGRRGSGVLGRRGDFSKREVRRDCRADFRACRFAFQHERVLGRARGEGGVGGLTRALWNICNVANSRGEARIRSSNFNDRRLVFLATNGDERIARPSGVDILKGVAIGECIIRVLEADKDGGNITLRPGLAELKGDPNCVLRENVDGRMTNVAGITNLAHFDDVRLARRGVSRSRCHGKGKEGSPKGKIVNLHGQNKQNKGAV
jgi:hypothetical protein